MRERISRETTRKNVYKYLKKRGAKGATDEEGHIALSLGKCTYRQMRTKLTHEGFVVANGVRSGKSLYPSSVWVVTDKEFE